MNVPVTNSIRFGGGTLQGIVCIGLGMIFFVIQDTMMKSLLGPFTVWQLICIRSLLTSLVLIPAILILGPPHRLLTPWWPIHLCRAGLFTAGFSLYYTAFPYMTLASVTTIFFSAPLITALFAAVFLKETIGIHRIGALVAGFLGVIVVMRPGSDSFQWVSVLPLICACTYAASQIIVRRMGDQESTITTGVYTLVFAGVFVVPLSWALNSFLNLGEYGPHLGWRWDFGSLSDAAPLLPLAATGMIGYILLSRAYQVADASAVAPLEYAYIPMAAFMGYLVWNEIPSWNTLAGMGLIVASGVYVGYRELISSRRAKTPAPTGEASFVPGNPTPPES